MGAGAERQRCRWTRTTFSVMGSLVRHCCILVTVTHSERQKYGFVYAAVDSMLLYVLVGKNIKFTLHVFTYFIILLSSGQTTYLFLQQPELCFPSSWAAFLFTPERGEWRVPLYSFGGFVGSVWVWRLWVEVLSLWPFFALFLSWSDLSLDLFLVSLSWSIFLFFWAVTLLWVWFLDELLKKGSLILTQT